MFNYKGNRRYWDSMKRERGEGNKKKLLFLSRENQVLSCWRFENYYERLDGVAIHQGLARGEGEIVRHLCSDGRCVNPLHLVRGTGLENARDEIEVRDFEIKVFEEILDDYSMEGEDKALVHLTLLPKVSIKLVEERGIRSLKDTNNYVREMYRKSFVSKLIEKNDFSEEEIASAERILLALTERKDILVVIIPN